jgi:hypothetical protein
MEQSKTASKAYTAWLSIHNIITYLKLTNISTMIEMSLVI